MGLFRRSRLLVTNGVFEHLDVFAACGGSDPDGSYVDVRVRGAFSRIAGEPDTDDERFYLGSLHRISRWPCLFESGISVHYHQAVQPHGVSFRYPRFTTAMAILPRGADHFSATSRQSEPGPYGRSNRNLRTASQNVGSF